MQPELRTTCSQTGVSWFRSVSYRNDGAVTDRLGMMRQRCWFRPVSTERHHKASVWTRDFPLLSDDVFGTA